MKYARCLMLLADGARADCLEELLAAGALPHIARHLVARGGYAKGVTAFPSTTGPAYMPFLTGCLPATCNVPGIRWLDKRRYDRRGIGRWWPFGQATGRRSYVGIETFRINGDMTPGIATLFSLLPRSYSIFNSVYRGIHRGGNLTRLMRIWYWYYAHLTDRWGFVDTAATAKLLRLIRRDFQFGFVVFPGIDEYAHLSDPRHPRTLAAYRAVDQAVGLAAERLQRMGRYDETLLMLVSDHGLSATHTHFCLNTFLEARGIRTFFYPLVYKRRCVAANMMSGNGMTHLYFRHAAGWDRPIDESGITHLYPNLHDDLVAQVAVDIVATRSADGAIRIRSRRGAAWLCLEGSILHYVVEKYNQPHRGGEGGAPAALPTGGATQAPVNDPFGFPRLPTRMTSAEQLAATIGTDYPDALYQLAHLFTSPRTGDIVISAAPGYDLRDKYEIPEHKASHGSLHREHMLVPVAASAPLPAGPFRTVDLFPTILQYMGRAVPDGIDGRSL